MATFCVNCGSPLAVGAAFCPQCGTAAGNRSNPAPSVHPAPAVKSSSATKIIVVLLCCLVVGGIVVVGTVAYVAHRVKQAVVQKAAENGVDLGSLSSTTASTRVFPKPCDIISKEDISRLIGQPIERAETRHETCEYYGPAGLSAKLAQQEGQDELERAKSPGADPARSALQLQRMLVRAGQASGNAEAGSVGSGGELPLIVLAVSANGKTAMNALNLSKALFGAATKAVASSQGEDTKAAHTDVESDVFIGSSVNGLGDKAMWTPQSGLYVLQGDTLLQVNPGIFPDFNSKTIAVARAVLPKI